MPYEACHMVLGKLTDGVGASATQKWEVDERHVVQFCLVNFQFSNTQSSERPLPELAKSRVSTASWRFDVELNNLIDDSPSLWPFQSCY